MKKSLVLIFVFVLFSSVFSQEISDACTSILVSKGASTDGSVMVTYACDAEFIGTMRYIPAQDHDPDAYVEIRQRRRRRGGEDEPYKIKQVPHTYAVIGNINEHQVAIGETTTSGPNRRSFATAPLPPRPAVVGPFRRFLVYPTGTNPALSGRPHGGMCDES